MMKKKLLLITYAFLAAFSCEKDPEVVVTAGFSTNKDVYQKGEEIVIVNTSTVKGDILAFCKWEYGREANLTAFYGLEFEGLSFEEPGLYTISLTAYAEQGAGQDTYSREVLIIDENDVPWADFDCPAVAKVGEEVLFEDRSVDHVGGIKTWSWNIGGIESAYQSPVIVFDAPGAGIAVTLTVTDAYGLTDSQTKLIDIIE